MGDGSSLTAERLADAIGDPGIGRVTQVKPVRAGNGYHGLSAEYLEPETAPPGREAWLLGGGDDAEVVYARPPR